jgi:hypothetical protein
MTNKNPFEIRADMLKLAKDYMDQQYNMNVQLMNDMYEQGKKNYEEVQEAYQKKCILLYQTKNREKYEKIFSFYYCSHDGYHCLCDR